MILFIKIVFLMDDSMNLSFFEKLLTKFLQRKNFFSRVFWFMESSYDVSFFSFFSIFHYSFFNTIY